MNDVGKPRPVTIVTGGGSGIGAAIALQFAQLGWAVAVAGRRTALLEETARRLEEAGAPAAVVTADVGRVEQAQRVVQETLAVFGRIDALVNNAGIMCIERFEDTTPEAFDATIATNLRGPYFLTQAAIPALREASGSVVNIGSAAASLYRPGQSIYGSSKAALEYLTKSLAIELATHSIRVNAIVPGPIDTPVHAHAQPGIDPDAILASLGRTVPLGRMGTVEEVAWWVATLTAPEAAWVTGAIFHVDGGRVLTPPERPLL